MTLIEQTRQAIAGEVRAAIARKQGETAAAVSEATGIPRSTLSRKLNGQQGFGAEELLLIADHLGVSPAVFYSTAAVAESGAA